MSIWEGVHGKTFVKGEGPTTKEQTRRNKPSVCDVQSGPIRCRLVTAQGEHFLPGSVTIYAAYEMP